MRYSFVWPSIWQWWKLSTAPLSVHTFSFPRILYTHTHTHLLCVCLFVCVLRATSMEPIWALSLLFFLGRKKKKKAHLYYFSSNSDDEQQIASCKTVQFGDSVSLKQNIGKITVFLQRRGKHQVYCQVSFKIFSEKVTLKVVVVGGVTEVTGVEESNQWKSAVWTLSHNQSLCY